MIQDMDEQNATVVYQNPIPIKAIVTDLNFSSVQWKMPGIYSQKSKEVICNKKYKGLIEKSYKIQVQGNNDYYEGWKVSGKMQIREDGDYIRFYMYIKQV